MEKMTRPLRFSKLLHLILHSLLGLGYLCSAAFAFEAENVLVLRPEHTHFDEIFLGIEDGIDGEFELIDQVLDQSDNRDIHKLINRSQPRAIVLMDNAGVLAYKKYQDENPRKKFPPAIIVATLFADRVMNALENATAILYEIPALTSLADLKSTITDVDTVGVVYRDSLKHVFLKNRNLARLENIELVGVNVKGDASKRRVDKAVRKLLKKSPDALWILNDGDLLTGQLVRDVWIKRLGKFNKPVVVGIETLIQTKFQFGDYAVSPNLYDLGMQASDVLFDLMDNYWLIPEWMREPQNPISINKSVNIHLLKRKKLEVPRHKLDEFDRVLGRND